MSRCWDQDVSRPSTYPLETFERELESTDFAVFVFSPTDVVEIRGEQKRAVRDNVIFELGLFIGRLSRKRCFIVAPKNEELHLPTDLMGLTLAQYDSDRKNQVAALGAACSQIQRAIEEEGRIGHAEPVRRQSRVVSYSETDISSPFSRTTSTTRPRICISSMRSMKSLAYPKDRPRSSS